MLTPRIGHTATLLSNGKVLLAGGADSSGALSSAEIYDPATGKTVPTGAMNAARSGHTATLLQNGRVLVVAGGAASYLSSAEVYDPASETWTMTGGLSKARYWHTATLLLNGKVLVAGGYNGSSGGVLSNADLYDPDTGIWTSANAMPHSHYYHTATLLPNGKVLVAGIGADVFDPDSGTWSSGGTMTIEHSEHTATLLPSGLVLLAGESDTGLAAELFDPATVTWTATGSLNVRHKRHTACLLPDGRVLITGGFYGDGGPISSTELYDPTSGTWTNTDSLHIRREGHTTTLLPNGQVLLTGGYSSTSGGYLSSIELYEPTVSPDLAAWTNTGALKRARDAHTATLLPDGNVLIAGGRNDDMFVRNLPETELYDPVLQTFTSNALLNVSRGYHTATLLPSGKVLVAGGINSSVGVLSTTELYDPAAKLWALTGSPAFGRARLWHTATLLPSGKVLVAGGYGSSFAPVSTADVFNPVTGTWSATGSMHDTRYWHTATLLPSGKVLIAGGLTANAELYDPATGLWTQTGAMSISRALHTATLLPSGKVLVAGGDSSLVTELYDPANGTWTNTGSLNVPHSRHTATLLPNGKVLIVGGADGFTDTNAIATSELYDPVTGTWMLSAALNVGRGWHTATLLANGKILVAGGYGSTNYLTSAELYDPGLGYSNSWRPQITAVTSPLNLGGSLSVTGKQFRGLSEASSGNSPDSSTDYPLVQLRRIDNQQTTFLLCTNWSTNAFDSAMVWNFPPGPALATVFVNGIPSTSTVVQVSVPVPTPPTIIDARKLTNGGFQFSFTNTVGALFGALASTNVDLPFPNWTPMGGVLEIAPGQFQFTDAQATNSPQRFYGVRAP